MWTILLQNKYGVKAGYITGYETLVKHFSELMLEIDPHYLKLKKRGMSLLETVETNFLGFNDPSKHNHVVKNSCSASLVLVLVRAFSIISPWLGNVEVLQVTPTW